MCLNIYRVYVILFVFHYLYNVCMYNSTLRCYRWFGGLKEIIIYAIIRRRNYFNNKLKSARVN